jgi:hypothetical protein
MSPAQISSVSVSSLKVGSWILWKSPTIPAEFQCGKIVAIENKHIFLNNTNNPYYVSHMLLVEDGQFYELS